MRPSPSPTVRTLREQYAARLKSIRQRAGFTSRELATACSWHEAKISRIEHVKQVPTREDVQAWATVCGAEEELPDLLAMLESTDGMWVEWADINRAGGIARHMEKSRRLEARTRLFRVFEVGIIPGLLQTPQYARELLTLLARWKGLPTSDVEAAVAARLTRQRALASGARFAIVLEQMALRARVGEVETMIAQLAHLLAVAARQNVSLGIIPDDIRRTMWAQPGFWVFDDSRVVIETPSAELTITQPSEVAIYTRMFATLAEMAVTGAAARELIFKEISALSEEGP